MREQRPREKFQVLLFVEPRALDVEELQAGDKTREGERIDRELRDRLVRSCVGFEIQDMHGTVAHLQKVDVPRDRTLGRAEARRELDAVPLLQRSDVSFGEPD